MNRSRNKRFQKAYIEGITKLANSKAVHNICCPNVVWQTTINESTTEKILVAKLLLENALNEKVAETVE